MTLRRSVFVSALATALTFPVAVLMTGGDGSSTLAVDTVASAGAEQDVSAIPEAVPVSAPVVDAPPVSAAPVATVAPVVTISVSTQPKPATITIPTVPRTVETTAVPTTAAPKVSTYSTDLAGLSTAAAGSATVRYVETSGEGRATLDATASGLAEGQYVVQLSFRSGPVKTGFAVCSFTVTAGTSGGCSGSLDLPNGATLSKVFLTTLNGSGSGGAVAEGVLASR